MGALSDTAKRMLKEVQQSDHSDQDMSPIEFMQFLVDMAKKVEEHDEFIVDQNRYKE